MMWPYWYRFTAWTTWGHKWVLFKTTDQSENALWHVRIWHMTLNIWIWSWIMLLHKALAINRSNKPLSTYCSLRCRISPFINQRLRCVSVAKRTNGIVHETHTLIFSLWCPPPPPPPHPTLPTEKNETKQICMVGGGGQAQIQAQI